MNVPNDWEILNELLAELDDAKRRMVLYVVSKLAGKGPPTGAVALLKEAGVADEPPRKLPPDDPIVKKLLGNAAWPKETN